MVPGLTDIPAKLEAVSAAGVTLHLVYGPRRNLPIAKALCGTLDAQIGRTGFATVDDTTLVRWTPSDDVADRSPG
jgi:hypothetical protein